MKQYFFSLLALASFASGLVASPTPTPNPKETSSKSEKAATQPVSNDLIQSANGWIYVNGEWVHPRGYKFVNGRVLRTTARPGKGFPKPPGKLALQNPEKLTATAIPIVDSSSKAAADKAAEKSRNIAPRPAPQTGSHL